jgi:Mg2+ and Co2+ transporter CorA
MERLNNILSSLKGLGISPDVAEKISSIMDEYAGLKEQLPQQRRAQFTDDARDILVEMKQATNRNTELLSAFLRKFAEHVLRHAYDESGQARDIKDLVDHIPQMYDDDMPMPEEEGEDE